MRFLSRALFAAAGLAAIPLAMPPVGEALAQPADQPITIIAPYGPGTGTDLNARMIARGMTDALKRNVIVDNRAGASGMIGAEYVARQAPDGLTLMAGVNQIMATNPHFFKEVRYDPIKDFTPIALVMLNESLVTISSSVPATTVAELVAYAKEHPNALSYGSAGLGTTGHLAGELLTRAAGIEMIHVPYTSGQLFTDLLSGKISMAVYSYTQLKPHIDSGAVRILATTGTSRLAVLPDVPTMTELGYPKIVFTSWTGIYGPAGMDPKVAETLSLAVKETMGSAPMLERAADTGTRLEYLGPEEFAKFTASELERVGAVLKELGIEPQ